MVAKRQKRKSLVFDVAWWLWDEYTHGKSIHWMVTQLDSQSIELPSEVSQRLLTFAVAVGDVSAVSALLSHGCDPNTSISGPPVLHLAIEDDHDAIVRELVSRGAVVEGPTGALHVAAKWSRVSVAQFLLDLGANVDLPDDDHYTPLMYAVRRKDVNMARLLLSHGAQPNLRNLAGKSAFDMVEESGDSELIALFDGNRRPSAD